MLERQSNRKAWLYLAPALVLLLVFTFYPLFNALRLSFVYWTDTNTVGGFSLIYNFYFVLTDRMFWKALQNTAWIVFISVPVSVIVALLISVFLNSIKKFQSVFQTIFFLPYVTNGIAIGMAFAFIFNVDYGLFNMVIGWFGINPINWVNTGATWGHAMTALLIYTVWGGLAFKIMVFLSGLQSIDKQYYDAARIDATPRWRVFTRITVPLLSPMIMYITITSFIGAFKAYSTVVGMFGTSLAPNGALTKDSLITVVGFIYQYVNEIPVNPSAASMAAASAIILFLITLVFTGLQVLVSRKRVHY